jgi:hypothetical protein
VSGNDVVKTIDQLHDAEIQVGQAELVRALGVEKASEPTWIRRMSMLALRRDGVWCLGVRNLVAARPEDYAKPHALLHGHVRIDYHPIPEAVQLISGGAEAEYETRDRVLAESAAQRESNERTRRETEQREAAERQRADDHWKKDFEQFNGSGWQRTPSIAQSIFLQALVWEGTHPEQARGLRDLARSVITAGAGPGHLPFPRRRWDHR